MKAGCVLLERGKPSTNKPKRDNASPHDERRERAKAAAAEYREKLKEREASRYYPETGEPASVRSVFLNIVCSIALAILLFSVVTLSLNPSTSGVFAASITQIATTAVRVTEVISSNNTVLPDETGAFPDIIEIANLGVVPEDITGFTLSDDETRARFTFPNVTLEPGEHMIVFASGDENTSVTPYHAAMKVSAQSDIIYFRDNNGAMIQIVKVPMMPNDASYSKGEMSWRRTSEPTPGFPNTEAGRRAFLESIEALDSSLRLNEIMASNSVTLYDDDGETYDWLEVFNAGPTAIDLAGYALSDDVNDLVKWRFPAGCVLEPYSTLVVMASGLGEPSESYLHANFKLAADHGVVLLSDIKGGVVDSTEYDNLKPDTVWARRRNLTPWEMSATPTPGAINP